MRRRTRKGSLGRALLGRTGCGLQLPASLIGLGAQSLLSETVAIWYLGLTAATALVIWLTSSSRSRSSIHLRRILLRQILPASIILALAAATGYYYHRVTGNAFRMTYQVNRGTYSQAPYFLWQHPRPEPLYHHAVMRAFYQREFQVYLESRTLAGFFRNLVEKIWSAWNFYLGPVLTVALLALPWIFRDRRMRFSLLAGIVFLLATTVETWTSPHYLAAATGLLYLVLMQCMRHLRLWHWRGQPVGGAVVRVIPVICCAMIVLRLAAVVARAPIEGAWPRGNLERAAIANQLEKSPARNLVIVRYGPDHDLNREWVYNAADIDGAKTVWARDMGDRDNQELLRYFHDRRVWYLNADQTPPRLGP